MLERLERGPYPTRCGRPIHPDELGLSASRMNPENPHNKDNHHMGYYGHAILKASGLILMYHNLEILQVGLMKDTHHQVLHPMYTNPELPTPEQAFDLIDDQYEYDGNFRYGSLLNPTITPITRQDVEAAFREYEAMK